MNNPVVYDIVIIGGGIAGSAIARDAALRGAHVILFEKNEFGSGTSSKSSKLIHGGIRYLEVAWLALKRGDFFEFFKNLKFVIVSLRESHQLHKAASKLVSPLALLVPLYRDSKRSRISVYFGALLYGMLAQLLGGRHFPRFMFSKESVLTLEPGLKREGLLGGILLWDHYANDKALVMQIAASAQKHGAHLLEHAPVLDYGRDEKTGLYELTVQISGFPKKVLSRTLVNATGPWVDQVRSLGRETGPQCLELVAGSHLETKSFTQNSLILEAEDGRPFFIINKNDRARIGTTERPCSDPDLVSVTQDEMNYLLSGIKKYFPNAPIEKNAIESFDAGVRPLAKPKKDAPLNVISREHALVLGTSGVWHVLGVKLTDHRRAAEQVTQKVFSKLQFERPVKKTGSVTRNIPL